MSRHLADIELRKSRCQVNIRSQNQLVKAGTGDDRYGLHARHVSVGRGI